MLAWRQPFTIRELRARLKRATDKEKVRKQVRKETRQNNFQIILSIIMPPSTSTSTSAAAAATRNSSSHSNSSSTSSSNSNSTRSSSVKRSRAVQEQQKKKKKKTVIQNNNNNNNKRRLSLPHSIESATVANESKAQRRLSGRLSLKAGAHRRNSFSSNKSANAPAAAAVKDNNADSPPNKIQRPTPYAQVVLERGGTMSPTLTRSASKKKKQRLDDLLPPRHDRDDDQHEQQQRDAVDDEVAMTMESRERHHRSNSLSSNGGLLMLFSPPNQAENERRERQALARQEAERARRVQSARDNGQLLVFSPNGSNVVFPPNHREVLQENMDNVQRPTPSSTSTSAAAQQKKKSSSNGSGTPERTSSSRRQSSSSPAPLSSTKKKLEARCQELLEQSRALEETNAKVKEQNEQLQMDLDHANEEFLTQTANHQQDTSKLKLQFTGMQQQVESRVQGLELVRNKLEHQVSQLQSEKAALTSQTVELQQRAAQLQKELQQNQDAMAIMNRNSESEKEELALNLERLEQENATLRQELNVIATTETAMETKLVEYEQLIENLQHHLLPEKESQLETCLVTLRNKEQVVAELQEKMSTYTQLVQELRDEIQRMTSEMDKENVDLRTAVDQAHQDNGRLQAAALVKQAQMQQLVQQRDVVQANLDEAQASATAARDECNRRCTEMALRIDELNAALETTMHDLETSERAARDIQQQLEDAHGRLQQALLEKDGAHADQSQTSAALSDLQVQLAQARDRITSLERERDSAKKVRRSLEQNLSYATQECQQLEHQRDEARQHVAGFDAREAELTRRLQMSDLVRRDLHASVMTLMGNIRVFVRVRPRLAGEVEKMEEEQTLKNASPAMMKKRKAREMEHANGTDGLFRFPGLYDREEKTTTYSSSSTAVARATSSEDILKNIVEVTEPWKDRGGLSERRIKHRFGFDNVFSPSHGQQDVWEATEPLVQSAIDGFNVCIFAYGQTGSGKTYTMLGGSESSSSIGEEQGVIVRSVHKLFQAKQSIQELSKGDTQVAVLVELIEIYNEQVRDLLASGSGSSNSDKGDRRASLKVNSQQVVGNKIIATSTQEDVMRVLHLAQKRRCTKATSSNAESSRSHMLFTIHFEVTSTKNGMKRAGKLHVCDLAGSERLSKSGAHFVGGSLLEETKHINQSLSVLSNVIEKLQAGGNEKPPFRESQLTYILQNSLGGNSKTLAIVCCSPLPCNYHETLCSLRFAEKVNKVSLKKACANLSSSSSN